jgi:hypothetical protein
MIETISSLFRNFGVETPSQYARAMYKNTECGVWTVFITPNDKIYAGDLTKYQDTKEFAARYIVGIQHGTIVEGSEAEFQTGPLLFPFKMEELQAEIDTLQMWSNEAWYEANEE